MVKIDEKKEMTGKDLQTVFGYSDDVAGKIYADLKRDGVSKVGAKEIATPEVAVFIFNRFRGNTNPNASKNAVDVANSFSDNPTLDNLMIEIWKKLQDRKLEKSNEDTAAASEIVKLRDETVTLRDALEKSRHETVTEKAKSVTILGEKAEKEAKIMELERLIKKRDEALALANQNGVSIVKGMVSEKVHEDVVFQLRKDVNSVTLRHEAVTEEMNKLNTRHGEVLRERDGLVIRVAAAEKSVTEKEKAVTGVVTDWKNRYEDVVKNLTEHSKRVASDAEIIRLKEGQLKDTFAELAACTEQNDLLDTKLRVSNRKLKELQKSFEDVSLRLNRYEGSQIQFVSDKEVLLDAPEMTVVGIWIVMAAFSTLTAYCFYSVFVENGKDEIVSTLIGVLISVAFMFFTYKIHMDKGIKLANLRSEYKKYEDDLLSTNPQFDIIEATKKITTLKWTIRGVFIWEGFFLILSKTVYVFEALISFSIVKGRDNINLLAMCIAMTMLISAIIRLPQIYKSQKPL